MHLWRVAAAPPLPRAAKVLLVSRSTCSHWAPDQRRRPVATDPSLAKMPWDSVVNSTSRTLDRGQKVRTVEFTTPTDRPLRLTPIWA